MEAKQTVNNEIKDFIQDLEQGALKFKASPEFYEEVKIKRKRFGQILRNEKPATISELQNLANYFGFDFIYSFKQKDINNHRAQS